MSATGRKLEFSLEWIAEDDSTETARLLPTSARAKAWLDHHGMHVLLERANACAQPGQALHETLQDMLESDAGIAQTEAPPAATLTPGSTGEFAVAFDDDPAGGGNKIATVTALTERARGWLQLHGRDLPWRVSKEKRIGERLDAVHQRLMEQDLGVPPALR